MLTQVDYTIEDRIRVAFVNKGRGVALALVDGERLEELTYLSVENWQKDPLHGWGDKQFMGLVEGYDTQREYVVIIARRDGKYADAQAYLRRYRDKSAPTESA